MGHKCIADKTQSLEQTDPDRLKRVSNSSTFVNRSNCELPQTVGDVTMATAIFYIQSLATTPILHSSQEIPHCSAPSMCLLPCVEYHSSRSVEVEALGNTSKYNYNIHIN